MQMNMFTMYLLTIGLCLVCCLDAAVVDYASPLVFDPVFYVNTHPDLGHPTTPQAAEDHWLQHGITEGRQGSGQFHSEQYLVRYPDLLKAFGRDYHAAIRHYITSGQTEHRMGYVEGGFGGRYTISNGRTGDLFLSASARMAGAIDSLVWNHKEFVNAWDHGREIQMAVNAIPYAECFNPTEAGGASDYRQDSSKSVMENITVAGKVLKTSVLPAFWIRAGSHETHNATSLCHRDSPAVNTEDTYQHEFSKTVTLGCAGLDNCIQYNSEFVIAGKWPRYDFINLVAPAIYLTANFTQFLNYNSQNHQLEPHAHQTWPAVLATPDNQYALGVWAPSGQDSDKFMYYLTGTHDHNGEFAWKTNAVHVVFRKLETPIGSSNTYNYVSYMCVGSLSMVAKCMRKVQQTYPHI